MENPRSFESPHLGKGTEFPLQRDIRSNLDGADPVKIYQTITGIRSKKSQREHLKALVHDINLWYLSVEHWQSHGWNPNNIAASYRFISAEDHPLAGTATMKMILIPYPP